MKQRQLTREEWIERAKQRAKQLRRQRDELLIPRSGDNFDFVCMGGLSSLKLWRRNDQKRAKGVQNSVGKKKA